jgi:hypothetical protein
MRPSTHFNNTFKVASDKVKYNDEHIESEYEYQTTVVEIQEGEAVVKPVNKTYTFRTQRNVGRVGTMIVGLGGNNGTTVMAGIIANREGITWRTNKGVQTPNSGAPSRRPLPSASAPTPAEMTCSSPSSPSSPWLTPTSSSSAVGTFRASTWPRPWSAPRCCPTISSASWCPT